MRGEDPFRYAPVSRRRFVQLSAATGASLTLPGNATASASSEKFTDEYQYVLNHTPADHAVQTLVRFSDQSGPAAMEALLDGGVHTTTEPEPAAYAQLTTTEAERVADLPMASEFQFSPGSNPFWRLGYYPMGIFPEPRRSVDFIGFEQLKDGLEELERRCQSETYSQYENRIRVKNVGHSPGHYNNVTGREDPKGMYVVELTNFDSDTAFEDKEKVFFSCSLHGLEMAGRETGARVLENVARGSEPDVIEDEEKIEPYLDDVVVIIGFTNPDGWAVRNPQYDSGWQVGGPGTGLPRAPAAPLYERGNAEVFDTNRQYPVVGYLRPSHHPANPGDNPSEQPDYINEKVPDAAALVEFFRGYENLNYGSDLHGGPTFNNFVLGLISQDQFDTRELHELYEMCLSIDDTLEQALELWRTAGDLNKQVFGGGGFTIDDSISGNLGVVPTEAFDYATIYDTINYTVSGAFLDWMAHPEPIGLDLTTLDFEMSYNHIVGGNVYNPELFRMEVDGYRTAIRTITAFAVRNSETPNTTEQFSTRTETDGESVAYVTTGPVGSDDDALRVSSDDLRFDVERVTTEINSRTFSGVIGPGTPNQRSRQEHTFTAVDGAERVAAEASWGANVQDNELYLLDADGNRIASSTNFNAIEGPEHIAAAIEGGEEYTFVIETWANVVANYTIEASIQSVSYEETDSDSEETDDDGGSTILPTTTEAVEVGTGVTEVTYEVSGENLHSFGVETHEHGLVADAELVNPAGEVVSEYEAVREDRIGGKCGTVPEFVVSEPDEGTWTFRLTNRLDQAKHGEVTFWTLSSPGPNPDPKEVFGYEQRDYTATPFRFFEDYAEYVQDGGTIEPVTVQDVADGALLDANGAPAYDHVVVIHDYGANAGSQPGDGVYGYTPSDHPAQGFTTPGYTEALDGFVDAGGNLVLTDAGLNLVPKLQNALVDGSAIDESAIEAADGYQVARFTDGKNLDHPLLTDARPIQNQLWKVQPLGYQAFNGAPGQAPMFAIQEDALAEAGAGGVATVAGYNRQGVVAASVTESEDSGRGVHLVGSLLPRATQTNVHAFGLLDYTVSFLGNLIFTSALGFEQVRDTGETVRRYGRGDEWDLSGVEPLQPPDDGGNGGGGGSGTQLSASGSRDVQRNVTLGGRATQVTVTLDAVTTDAGTVEVRDSFPPEWTFLPDFSDGTETEDGVVSFGGISTKNFGGAEFTYFIESPDDPAQTNQYQVGPGEVAVATADGEVTDEFAPPSDIVAVGLSP